MKTRLTPPLTAEEAAGLNICFLQDTSAAIADATKDGSAVGIGVYTPVGEEAAYAGILPKDFLLIAQKGDAFGERLIFATEDLLHVGFQALCLIDSDSPTVPAHAYSEAVGFLSQPGDRVVLGPSDDGGYYLIGMKRLHRELFEGIDWSTERVAEQTMQRAAELAIDVKMLPTWYDVDDRITLRRLCDELLGPAASEGYAAPRTRAYLTAIIEKEGRHRIWPNE
ncbi:MAG: TIGR04282 family arsenosugar biosynthesis glycosyltransferase [Verrucomicrobiota bacterium]|nr:TIGR04282 family arsenosugar biosynthesis glycosyltransferase [Verrucomicrobiota bacterium]